MILEMHSHTSEHSSCSHVAAADLVRRAFEQGLQGIVLTDHHFWWPPEALQELKRLAKVPKYFLVFSGQEVTTFDVGDVLVYGADTTIKKGTPLPIIRERFPHAALVWAHPYRGQRRPLREQLLNPLLDGIEIFNTNHTFLENNRGLHDWHEYKFTAIAGTDTHALSYTGTFPTLFDHPVDSIEELAEELKAGRCRPFFKEIPRAGSSIQITELTIGTAGVRDGREKIIIKELDQERWESADRAFFIMKELAAHGFGNGLYRVPKPLSREQESRTLIEQGIRGRTLFDSVLHADHGKAESILELAARWLARFHNLRLRITPPEEFLAQEPDRLGKYLSAFTTIDHHFSRRAGEIVDIIRWMEHAWYEGRPELLVQGHGDFNPKNILIGYANDGEETGRFVAGIDFDRSRCMPPAFDVGTFLAQFHSQFYHYPEVREKVSEMLFLDTYLEHAEVLTGSFLAEVELFRARADMSIAYLFIMVGMGKSEDLWRVIVDADQRLAHLALQGVQSPS
jgi:3',5'-nucleoside bisphosphate phosphatase